MIRSILLLSFLVLFASCASNFYVNKDKCVELGGPVLECQRAALIK